MDSSLKLSSTSVSKLPIKRKTPDSNSTLLYSKPEEQLQLHDQPISAVDFTKPINVNPPPFKYHRIWTEPDEIRFLQGLLDSASLGFSFPRDLHLFYMNFSSTMSLLYSKYQLSEKLRRLRKKFCVISARISHGLNDSHLSLHDRNLYELSKKLWSPEYFPSSPFAKNSNWVGVEVGFSATLQALRSNIESDNSEGGFVNDDEGKICGVMDVGYGFVGQQDKRIGVAAARSVVNVFDESLKEVSMILANQGLVSSGQAKEGKEKDFERRWREQRFAEFDVLTRRLRLVLENSFNRQ